jgi:hypothetical protein
MLKLSRRILTLALFFSGCMVVSSTLSADEFLSRLRNNECAPAVCTPAISPEVAACQTAYESTHNNYLVARPIRVCPTALQLSLEEPEGTCQLMIFLASDCASNSFTINLPCGTVAKMCQSGQCIDPQGGAPGFVSGMYQSTISSNAFHNTTISNNGIALRDRGAVKLNAQAASVMIKNERVEKVTIGGRTRSIKFLEVEYPSGGSTVSYGLGFEVIADSGDGAATDITETAVSGKSAFVIKKVSGVSKLYSVVLAQ